MLTFANFNFRKSGFLVLLVLILSASAASRAQNISTFAGNGINGFSGDGGAATGAALNQPVSVCFDASGNLYFADYGNNRIRKVNTAGIISTIAGNGNASYSGDGGAATLASLNNPIGLCVDNLGNVYIADSYNDRIRKVNAAGIISTFAGIGLPGFTGDGGPASAAKIYEPTGICVDGLGNFYIADNNNNRIRKINTSGIISTIAGIGTGGYSGDGGPATSAQIYFPYEVSVDANQNLFIADYMNNRIRKVNAAGTITTVAGNGNGGYSGDGGVATSAEIYFPQGVTIDTAGNIYIADFLNHAIRKVDIGGNIHSIAGNGNGGYSGDGGPATTAMLYYPTGVRTDTYGNVYIADSFNDRIRKITTTSAGINIVSVTENFMEFPNPANQNFIIQCNSCNQHDKLELYDFCGRIIFHRDLNPGKTFIDTKNLANGFYELKTISNKGVTFFSKIEIIHQ